MSDEITLPHQYKPRFYQLPVLKALDKGYKRVVWVMHRRGGKDLTILNWCIKEIAVGQAKTCWYLFPSYKQAKRVIWDGMTKDGKRFMSHIPEALVKKKNSMELKIEFTNGSIMQLLGSDQYDSLVGSGPSIVVFSEAALHDPRAWAYIRPMLRETNGTAIFISTPRGKNWFYQMVEQAKLLDDWWCQTLTIEETGALTMEDIAKERREGMSEEMIQQEYYTSFDSSIEGAYYSRIITKLRKDGHIQKVSYDEDLMVYTAWDLGFSDSTCIIWYQLKGEHVRVLDCYENHGYQLAHYMKVIKEKPYVYGGHFAPHDGKAHDRAGSTFIAKAQEYGIDFQVLPQERSILDGIERVRAQLPYCYFDTDKTERLVQCLEHYHAEYDTLKQVYNRKPDHDFSSHMADCFRYLVNSMDYLRDMRGEMTKEKLEEMKYKAIMEYDTRHTPDYKMRR